LILQYHRAPWGKAPESLAQADMIENNIGQGASTGVGTEVVGARTDARLRAQLGVGPGRKAVIRSHHPELEAMPLADLVARLRDLTRGGPIGVKLAPGRRLEEDLAVCLDARVDVIALDGAQAGTKGSPPILQDDFGLPTLHGLVRAVRFLESAGVRDRVSLVVGGGLFAPGDFLKVLALGADAVYIGTAALFAISHGQTFKSLPWEPPTQLVFYGGHQAHRLDVDEAADRLARFLRSAAAEMAIAVRALGKTAIRDVGKEDLTALDPHTARVCGVPVSYRAPLRVSPAISARRPPEVR
ncbi:MAG: FMN-binding glutamate synthase family protein, partial [Firmicutes bacterium]|nr:FMN-binding glutamate synthase family protein [Bacillota bacterium]